jgi:ribA/ribD-fused uncharacterized protein
MDGIYGFFKEYRWLSNFHMCDVMYDGVIYPSSEHAYQAAKFLDLGIRDDIKNLKEPKDARKMGRREGIRENWDDIKYDIMTNIVFNKFVFNEGLKNKLIETHLLYLEETNWWGDTYWGVCNGVGHNYLGLIIMSLRAKLILKEKYNWRIDICPQDIGG